MTLPHAALRSHTSEYAAIATEGTWQALFSNACAVALIRMMFTHNSAHSQCYASFGKFRMCCQRSSSLTVRQTVYQLHGSSHFAEPYLYTPWPVFRPSSPASTYCVRSGHGRYLVSPSPPCRTRITDRHVSSPMRSARARGPIGWLVPSFMPMSMSSGDATPSISAKKASLIIGIRMRFTTKPGLSADTLTCLPMLSDRARVVRYVFSSVCIPRMISIRLISGGGFIQCIPTFECGVP
mmetsp:Transcript_47573/g.121410  ORF Transcript_47573/g.121410 Transcript_47573/m.121410 type:complete len:238 (-) Transcript_47573:657-1370(-)